MVLFFWVVGAIFSKPFYIGSQYYLLIYMGRRSVAEEIWESYEGEEEAQDEGVWLVLYDFKGMKPNPRFWGNVKRLISLAGDGVMLQYSVFSTSKRRSALTAAGIAQHYGAEVVLFQGKIVDL